LPDVGRVVPAGLALPHRGLQVGGSVGGRTGQRPDGDGDAEAGGHRGRRRFHACGQHTTMSRHEDSSRPTPAQSAVGFERGEDRPAALAASPPDAVTGAEMGPTLLPSNKRTAATRRQDSHHPLWPILASWAPPEFVRAEPLDLTHPAVVDPPGRCTASCRSGPGGHHKTGRVFATSAATDRIAPSSRYADALHPARADQLLSGVNSDISYRLMPRTRRPVTSSPLLPRHGAPGGWTHGHPC